MGREEVWTEELGVDGESLPASLRDLIREGKVRRIVVKNAEGKTLLKVPMWLGAAAVLNNPGMLLFGAWKSSRDPLTLIVERVGPPTEAREELVDKEAHQ